MPDDSVHLPDLAAPPGWSAERVAAARAVAVPNDRRIAQAAVQRLTPEDHSAAFAAWCDAFARDDAAKVGKV